MSPFSAKNELSAYSNVKYDAKHRKFEVKCYLFENGAFLAIGHWSNNLVKMATLEEEKPRRTV